MFYPETVSPEAARGPFRVVSIVPVYDNRDAICGQRVWRDYEPSRGRSPDHELVFETYAGACWRLRAYSEEWESEAEVIVLDAACRRVREPEPPRPVPAFDPDDLPF